MFQGSRKKSSRNKENWAIYMKKCYENITKNNNEIQHEIQKYS